MSFHASNPIFSPPQIEFSQNNMENDHNSRVKYGNNEFPSEGKGKWTYA